jgi:TolB protein
MRDTDNLPDPRFNINTVVYPATMSNVRREANILYNYVQNHLSKTKMQKFTLPVVDRGGRTKGDADFDTPNPSPTNGQGQPYPLNPEFTRDSALSIELWRNGLVYNPDDYTYDIFGNAPKNFPGIPDWMRQYSFIPTAWAQPSYAPNPTMSPNTNAVVQPHTFSSVADLLTVPLFKFDRLTVSALADPPSSFVCPANGIASVDVTYLFAMSDVIGASEYDQVTGDITSTYHVYVDYNNDGTVDATVDMGTGEGNPATAQVMLFPGPPTGTTPAIVMTMDHNTFKPYLSFQHTFDAADIPAPDITKAGQASGDFQFDAFGNPYVTARFWVVKNEGTAGELRSDRQVRVYIQDNCNADIPLNVNILAIRTGYNSFTVVSSVAGGTSARATQLNYTWAYNGNPPPAYYNGIITTQANGTLGPPPGQPDPRNINITLNPGGSGLIRLAVTANSNPVQQASDAAQVDLMNSFPQVLAEVAADPPSGNGGINSLLHLGAYGGSSPYRYRIDIVGPNGAIQGSPFTLDNQTANESTFLTPNLVDPGTYTITVTATDTNGTASAPIATTLVILGRGGTGSTGLKGVPSMVASINVEKLPPPKKGFTLTPSVSGGRGQLAYQWEVRTPDGRICTENWPTVTIPPSAAMVSNDSNPSFAFDPSANSNGVYIVKLAVIDRTLEDPSITQSQFATATCTVELTSDDPTPSPSNTNVLDDHPNAVIFADPPGNGSNQIGDNNTVTSLSTVTTAPQIVSGIAGWPSIVPEMAPVGATIQIFGFNFDPVAANNTVTFGGNITATPIAVVDSGVAGLVNRQEMDVVVPTGALSGYLTVANSGGTSNRIFFMTSFVVDFDLIGGSFNYPPSGSGPDTRPYLYELDFQGDGIIDERWDTSSWGASGRELRSSDGTFHITHDYSADGFGSYTATLTVTDITSGKTSVAKQFIQINDLRPMADNSGNYSVANGLIVDIKPRLNQQFYTFGETATFDSYVSGLDTQGILGYQWILDGALVGGNFPSVTFVPPDDGRAHELSLKVTASTNYAPPYEIDLGRVLFQTDVTDPGGNNEIFTMRSSGSLRTDISNDPVDNIQPAWSPNGTVVLWMDQTGISYRLVTANPDGTNRRNLNIPGLPAAGVKFAPWYSPDATKIIFAFRRVGGANEVFNLYTINNDGSGVQQLTNGPLDSTVGKYLPDSSKIYYLYGAVGTQNLWSMNPDGAGKAQVPGFTSFISYFDISHDGTKIVYITPDAGGNHIHIADIDGSNDQALTAGAFNDDWCNFSWGGGNVVFTSNRSGNSQIWIMHSDGTAQTNISNNAASELCPTLGPPIMSGAFTTQIGSTDTFVFPPTKPLATANVNSNIAFNPPYALFNRDGVTTFYQQGLDGSAPLTYYSDINLDGVIDVTGTFPDVNGNMTASRLNPLDTLINDGSNRGWFNELPGLSFFRGQPYQADRGTYEAYGFVQDAVLPPRTDWTMDTQVIYVGGRRTGGGAGAAPFAANIFVSPLIGTQSTQFSLLSYLSGGSGNYTYVWNIQKIAGPGSPASINGFNNNANKANAANPTFVPATDAINDVAVLDGTYQVTLTASDGNGVVSDIQNIVVQSMPLSAQVFAVPPAGNVGQTISFVVYVDGGAPPYTVGIDYDGDGTIDDTVMSVASPITLFQHAYNQVYLDRNADGNVTDINDGVHAKIQVTDKNGEVVPNDGVDRFTSTFPAPNGTMNYDQQIFIGDRLPLNITVLASPASGFGTFTTQVSYTVGGGSLQSGGFYTVILRLVDTGGRIVYQTQSSLPNTFGRDGIPDSPDDTFIPVVVPGAGNYVLQALAYDGDAEVAMAQTPIYSQGYIAPEKYDGSATPRVKYDEDGKPLHAVRAWVDPKYDAPASNSVRLLEADLQVFGDILTTDPNPMSQGMDVAKDPTAAKPYDINALSGTVTSQSQVVDFYDTYTFGRVNINTASEDALAAVFSKIVVNRAYYPASDPDFPNQRDPANDAYISRADAQALARAVVDYRNAYYDRNKPGVTGTYGQYVTGRVDHVPVIGPWDGVNPHDYDINQRTAAPLDPSDSAMDNAYDYYAGNYFNVENGQYKFYAPSDIAVVRSQAPGESDESYAKYLNNVLYNNVAPPADVYVTDQAQGSDARYYFTYNTAANQSRADARNDIAMLYSQGQIAYGWIPNPPFANVYDLYKVVDTAGDANLDPQVNDFIVDQATGRPREGADGLSSDIRVFSGPSVFKYAEKWDFSSNTYRVLCNYLDDVAPYLTTRSYVFDVKGTGAIPSTSSSQTNVLATENVARDRTVEEVVDVGKLWTRDVDPLSNQQRNLNYKVLYFKSD